MTNSTTKESSSSSSISKENSNLEKVLPKKPGTLDEPNFEKEALERLPRKGQLDPSEFKKAALENRKKHLENSLIEQELHLKEKICDWVIRTVSNYLITVFALIITTTVICPIFATIFPIFPIKANLSDHVLITLLTTTTISLIGLPTLIIKSLFPSKKDSPKKSHPTRQN